MLRFRRGDPVASTSAEEPEGSRSSDEVKDIKRQLLTSLRNYESVIFYFQQILVWERPFHSAVFVLLLHMGFWYLKVWSTHAMGLLASILLLAIWLDMWKHRIWPEIRARDPDPEADEWGELHPRLLSLPELCLILAEFVITVKSYQRVVWDFRNHSPGKFAFVTSACCVMAIMIGRSIPGTLLAYIIMVCCLLWPLIWYRRWVERAYSRMEPFFMQLQYSLKPRMRRNGKKAPHITKKIDGTSVEVHTDSSSDDEDISEFMKPLDAVTAEVLARALTDDDELSESDESLLAHELPSFPRPSSKDGDKGAHMSAEVPLPEDPPCFEDPDFAKKMLDEDSSADEDLGVPEDNINLIQQMPALAQQMIATVATKAVTDALKDTLDKAMGRDSTEQAANDDSRRSTPSDDGFVMLDENDARDD